MYCGQCGKRVLDTMLFCPFCGSPIVIPEQDAADAAETEQVRPAAMPEHAAPGGAQEPVGGAPVAPEPEPDEAEGGEDWPFAPGAEETAAVAEPAPAPADVAATVWDSDFGAADAIESAPLPQGGAADAPAGPEDAAPREADVPGGEPAPEAERERPLSLFDDAGDAAAEPPREGGDGFAPLDLDELGEADGAEPDEAGEIDSDKPARERGDAPQPERAPRERRSDGPRRGKQSYIPVKDVDMNDIFMDNSHPGPGEDYDEFGEDDYDGDYDEDFDYEEPEPGSFMQRHIRGLVGLVLFAILIVIFLIWAAMPNGQRALATINLAWNAKVYDDLGHEAYEEGQYRQAATYFEHALARDGENYEYAHSAMVAYYEAENKGAALAMLKKCIEMNPDSPEPYHELLILYPDASDRPWEVEELLRQGYERTGDETLKVETAE